MAAACAAAGALPASADEKISGVVERVAPDGIVVDSSVVVLAKGGRVSGDVKNLAAAKVGFWAEAQGRFRDRGDFEASRVKIRREAPGVTFADNLDEISLKESRKLDASDKIYRDPQAAAYVREVAERLVPDHARAEHDFSFEIIRDPSLNAFALPGGAIYVHTGLLARLDNEAQLAVILGHEIGHVTQKHGQRQYKANVAVMVPAQIGAVVLGVQLERRTDNPLVQIMAGLGLNLGLSAAVNGYGRTLEDQADRVGLRYAAEAGYDTREGPKVWDIFNDVYGDEGRVENFFYGNHSTNAVRKENLRTEIGRHYRGRGEEGDPPVVNEEIYQRTMLDLTRDNAVDDFDLERYRLSARGFERVLRHRPADPVARHYSGRIVLATDEAPDAPQKALSEYLRAVSVAPDYADVHRDLGLLYQKMGRPADARAHLERYLELAPAGAKDRKDVEKALEKVR
jgi:predicted Zn-dependent protease